MLRQRTFNYGQIYVALSCAKSLAGVHILGHINSKHIRADPRVDQEYQRLRDVSVKLFSTQFLQPSNTFEKDSPLCISLLNVRCLRKHSIDVKFDQNIFMSDILSFTETQPKHKDTKQLGLV